jgi:hypothetical protein
MEQVGIHDNFFDLGGHSLLLIEVHSRLESIFEPAASVVDMFEYPTISTLAKYLTREKREPAAAIPADDLLEKERKSKERRKRRFQQRQQAEGELT